ncbi:MAG: DUF58 domain-containing protein [Microbacterium gubbeenense]|uniref:DUF58 domain-containing protein n=1 Tax=Microbacterium gubbeenense TaxID=159896 RepID=UPI003F98BDE1
MRGRILPTRRGIGLLVVGIALVVTGSALDRVELTYVGLVLGGIVVASAAVVALAPSPGRVTRSGHDDLVAVGDPLRVATAFTGGSVAFIEDAADAVSPGLAQERDDDADPRSAVSWVTPTRRGAHRIGPLRIELLSSFGAVRARRHIGGVDAILAVPPVVPLASIRARGIDEGDHPAKYDRTGHGTDNLIPRPYVAGDSMRRVHWRASAHHGDLMVREEERDQSRTAAVLVDLDPAVWADENAFDVAMTACVSVVARLLSDGFLVDVTAADGSSIATVSSRQSFDDLLRACAVLEPLGQGRGLAALPADAGVVVAIGSAAPPPKSPAPHLLLTAPGGSAPPAAGWRSAPLEDDVAATWAFAIDGRAR